MQGSNFQYKCTTQNIETFNNVAILQAKHQQTQTRQKPETE